MLTNVKFDWSTPQEAEEWQLRVSQAALLCERLPDAGVAGAHQRVGSPSLLHGRQRQADPLVCHRSAGGTVEPLYKATLHHQCYPW